MTKPKSQRKNGAHLRYWVCVHLATTHPVLELNLEAYGTIESLIRTKHFKGLKSCSMKILSEFGPNETGD